MIFGFVLTIGYPLKVDVVMLGYTPFSRPNMTLLRCQGRRWPVAVALLKAFGRLRAQPSVLAKDSENTGRNMRRYMAALGETRGTNWYSVVFRKFFLCIGT